MAVPFATRKTFLDLPPELRRAIYECSLDDMLRMEGKLTVWSGGRRSVVFDWRKWRNGARDQGTGTGTGLRTLWTCKQIRTEAMPVLGQVRLVTEWQWRNESGDAGTDYYTGFWDVKNEADCNDPKCWEARSGWVREWC